MRDALRAKTEGRGIDVAGLRGEARPVDGASVEAGRGAGLKATSAQAEIFQGLAEQDCVGLAGASGGILLLAAVDEAVEKSSGGDDYGGGADGAAVAEFNAEDSASGFSALGFRSLNAGR